MTMTWRDAARPIIAAVIEQHGAEDTYELRKAFREAYPFGEREYHPYKVWLDEIKVQTGQKAFGQRRWKKSDYECEGQGKLF